MIHIDVGDVEGEGIVQSMRVKTVDTSQGTIRCWVGVK